MNILKLISKESPKVQTLLFEQFDNHIYHEVVCEDCKKSGSVTCPYRPVDGKFDATQYGTWLENWIKSEKINLTESLSRKREQAQQIAE